MLYLCHDKTRGNETDPVLKRERFDLRAYRCGHGIRCLYDPCLAPRTAGSEITGYRYAAEHPEENREDSETSFVNSNQL